MEGDSHGSRRCRSPDRTSHPMIWCLSELSCSSKGDRLGVSSDVELSELNILSGIPQFYWASCNTKSGLWVEERPDYWGGMGMRTLSADAHNRALSAAREVLVNSGILGFTVDAVATRSGVAKTTIYRHWSCRDTLLADTIVASLPMLPTPSTGALRTDLGQLLALVFARIQAPGFRSVVVDLWAAEIRSPALRVAKDALLERGRKPLFELLERAQDRGELAQHLDYDLSADLVGGTVLSRMLVRCSPVSELELGKMAIALTAALKAIASKPERC